MSLLLDRERSTDVEDLSFAATVSIYFNFGSVHNELRGKAEGDSGIVTFSEQIWRGGVPGGSLCAWMCASLTRRKVALI